jgi:excisionase family DNA binding protein
MTNEPEKWSNIDEVAEHLGVHKDTIRNWVRRGVIPAHKVGKFWKFRFSEVDEWVTSGKSTFADEEK